MPERRGACPGVRNWWTARELLLQGVGAVRVVRHQAASFFAHLQNNWMCFTIKPKVCIRRAVDSRSVWLMRAQPATVVVALLVISLIGGCQREPEPGAKAGNENKLEIPPPEVGAVSPVQRKIKDYREYTGRTAAVDIVDVRPRVSGYILETPRSTASEYQTSASQILESSTSEGASSEKTSTEKTSQVKVSEGGVVKEDELLFLIDPEPYDLAERQATASIAAAQATLTRNEKEYGRLRQLRASNSISQAEVDESIAALEESKAQVENLNAAKERAELDLRFTRVLAPFDGLVGQALVTRGNLVVADTTVLTTVVSTDPIYVYFDVDEESLLDYRRRIRSGSVESARDATIEISMSLANETDFVHQGYIDFVDNTTDPDTGNTRIRGTFPNADNALSPGLFARVKVPFTAEYPALMVPTRALGMDQQGRFLLVVDDESDARRRAVEVGTEREGMTVISKGLKLEDVVIVEGLQKARLGAPVKVVPYKEDVSAAKMSEGAAP